MRWRFQTKPTIGRPITVHWPRRATGIWKPTISETLEYPRPAGQAFADVLRALKTVGRVLKHDAAKLSLRGTIGYGFQNVRVKARIIEVEGRTRVTITALKENLWGTAAVNAVQRFVEALGYLDDCHYRPNRSGVTGWELAMQVLALLIVIIPMVLWALHSPPLTRTFLITIGALVISCHLATIIIFDRDP
jgi:hypothetical protein